MTLTVFAMPLSLLLSRIALVPVLLLAAAAQAQTLNFNISAEISPATCNISVGDIARDIELPQVNVRDFAAPGVVDGHRDFTLTVEDCPAGLTAAVFTFTGNSDPDSALRFANTGTAAGFGLQLSSQPGNDIISSDATNNRRVMLITGSQAALNLRASYWRSGRAISSGTLVSQVVFEMTYL
jgi:type 1 fimbria pilin